MGVDSTLWTARQAASLDEEPRVTTACRQCRACEPAGRAAGTGGRPLFTLIRGRDRSYCYDTASNRIFTLTDTQAAALARNPVAPRALAAIRRESGFLAPLTDRAPQPGIQDDEVRSAVRQNCSQLVLELTQQCNLRCRYCVYHVSAARSGRRTFSPRRLSPDMARLAVDRFAEHAAADAVIGFYGGEPLLAFDLLRETVAHARRRFARRRLDFTVTTNGTLLTPEMADFFAAEDFTLVVSVDGPRELHDANRVFPDGRGSYARVLANLHMIRERAPDYFRKSVLFSVVATGGYDLKALNEWMKMFPGNDFRLSAVRCYGDRFHRALIRDGIRHVGAFRDDVLRAARVGRLEAALETDAFRIHNRLFADGLRQVMSRPAATAARRAVHLGICIPGQRKVFVAADGTLYPCENVDGYPHLQLGDLESWVLPDRVVRIVDEFYRTAFPSCRNCWAQRLCRLCYAAFCWDGRYHKGRRQHECRNQRSLLQNALNLFVAASERNPDALTFLLPPARAQTAPPRRDATHVPTPSWPGRPQNRKGRNHARQEDNPEDRQENPRGGKDPRL